MNHRKRVIELLMKARYTTNDIEKVADELLDTVGQSKHLVAYTKWLQDNYNFEFDAETLVNEYTESN